MASGIIGDIARLDREGGRRKTKDVLVVTLVRGIACGTKGRAESEEG